MRRGEGGELRELREALRSGNSVSEVRRDNRKEMEREKKKKGNNEFEFTFLSMWVSQSKIVTPKTIDLNLFILDKVMGAL